MLCPDIELYTSGWQRLDSLEDERGGAITLRASMVFLAETYKYGWLKDRIETPFTDSIGFLSAVFRRDDRSLLKWDAPRGVHRMIDLHIMTRLDNVLTTLSPATVFVNANVRQCSESRAPAIMSALSITDWYQPRLKGHKSHARLVFSLYPLAFLQEAAAKIGAVFYDTRASNSLGDVTWKHIFLSRKDSLGSILPISTKLGYFSEVVGSFPHNFIDRHDHEAVSTWNIRQDGSVSISLVGLAAISNESHWSEPVGGILSWKISKPQERESLHEVLLRTRYSYDWRETLREIAGLNTIVAVALYEDVGHQHGLLLQKLPYSWFGKEYFVSCGNYVSMNNSRPLSQKVNWKVL